MAENVLNHQSLLQQKMFMPSGGIQKLKGRFKIQCIK